MTSVTPNQRMQRTRRRVSRRLLKSESAAPRGAPLTASVMHTIFVGARERCILGW